METEEDISTHIPGRATGPVEEREQILREQMDNNEKIHTGDCPVLLGAHRI